MDIETAHIRISSHDDSGRITSMSSQCGSVSEFNCTVCRRKQLGREYFIGEYPHPVCEDCMERIQ